MDAPNGQEGLPNFDRIYTLQELIELFELQDGDYQEALTRRLPHSNFGPSIVFSGADVLRTIARWGLSGFLDAVRDDRDW